MADINTQEHDEVSGSKLNWLRAAVLGANDGIVSTASIILGVVGATNERSFIFIAGLAGLVAGALSMAVGEYVSVSSQRDVERKYIKEEKEHLKNQPEKEEAELAKTYKNKGLSDETAARVAKELSEHDPVRAHLEAEFGIDEGDLNSPLHAGFASLVAFISGGIIPLIAVLVVMPSLRFPVTFVAVLIALAITGFISATIGKAPRTRAVLRVMAGGAVAMIFTYGVGSLFGVAIG